MKQHCVPIFKFYDIVYNTMFKTQFKLIIQETTDTDFQTSARFQYRPDIEHP